MSVFTCLAAVAKSLEVLAISVLLTKLAGGPSAEHHLTWQLHIRAAPSDLGSTMDIASQVLVDVTCADPGSWAQLASDLVQKAAVVELPLVDSFGHTFLATSMRLLICLDLLADTARLGAHMYSMCPATFLSYVGVDG